MIAHLGRRPGLAIALVWLAVSAVLALASPHLAAGRFPDTDDVMRLVQVRDLLAGQGWFDLFQHRMSPPEGTLMHWSRLVDAPLAALVWLLALIMPMGDAEWTAAIAVPLLLLLMTMLATGRLAWRRLGPGPALIACASFALVALLPAQFQPLRIDHHGWQIMTVVIAAWAVLRDHSPRGAIIAGLAMAAGLMVSLETVFMAAAFALVLVWRWLADDDARRLLVRYLQALAGGLIVLFAATRGMVDLAPHCDAIAPAHLGLFVIVAAGTTALAGAAPRSRLVILGALGAIGLTGIALVGWAAPACLAPPFAGLDPLVRELWYVRVTEGLPLWHRPLAEALPALIQCLAALAIVLWNAVRGQHDLRGWWREYGLLLAVAILGGLATYRSIAFAALLATIPLGWLAWRVVLLWRARAGLPLRLAAAAGVYVLFLPAPLVSALAPLLAQPGAVTAPAATGTVANSSCEMHANARLLDRLPAGTVFAPLDLGPGLLLDTRHAVVASSHHRAMTGMTHVIAGFTAEAEAARAIVTASGAHYVVTCADIGEMAVYRQAGGAQSLAARLSAGDAPDWLEAVAIGGPEGLRAWRVKR
jgi:hypothetical protein